MRCPVLLKRSLAAEDSHEMAFVLVPLLTLNKSSWMVGEAIFPHEAIYKTAKLLLVATAMLLQRSSIKNL